MKHSPSQKNQSLASLASNPDSNRVGSNSESSRQKPPSPPARDPAYTISRITYSGYTRQTSEGSGYNSPASASDFRRARSRDRSLERGEVGSFSVWRGIPDSAGNRLGYNTTGRLRYCAIPTVPSNSSSPPSSLKVSLPPEDSVPMTTPPTSATPPSPHSIPDQQSAGRYGSIPQLETSPRRFRHSSESRYYESGASSLEVPTFTRVDSGGSNDSKPELPPKLPEKPNRHVNRISPPPLPPKKPTNNTQQFERDDIYDFVPDPKVGSGNHLTEEESRKCISEIITDHSRVVPGGPEPIDPQTETDFVTLEQLSKMSIMELNQKMEQGLLPDELKGMSIFELVDHVSKKMKEKQQNVEQSVEQSVEIEEESEMKPSFSDNFVSSHLNPNPDQSRKNPPPAMLAEQTSSISSMSPGPPTAMRDMEFEFNRNESPKPVPQITNDDLIKKLKAMQKTPEPDQPEEENEAKLSLPTSSSKSDSGPDKYAVFRELQMEDELMRAWKSPSSEEEENPVKDEENHSDYKPRVCSSEGSPCSRSDSRKSASEKSASEKSDSEMEEEENDEKSEKDEERKRDSQVPLCNAENMDLSRTESQKSGEEEDPEKTHSVMKDSFESTFGPAEDVLVSKSSTGWATFEESGSPDKTQDDNPPRVRWPVNRDDFDSDHELQQYYNNFESRLRVTMGRRGVVSSQDRPYNHKIRRRFSRDSLDDQENPFGRDTFTPPVRNMQRSDEVSVTPPVFEGEAANLRNNAPDTGSEMSGEWALENDEDIFENKDALSGNTQFRIHVKTADDSGIPKSDSVNIFTVKEDPFDDDFFS